MSDNIFYIHTTASVIDYITLLSKRYLPSTRIFHILDESILFDIKQGDTESAKTKLMHAIDGGLHSGAKRFMVTCTSTGQLVDSLDDKYKSTIVRLESPAIAEIERRHSKTGIVYTNPTVWPEMQIILKRAGIHEPSFTACYVADAFESILSGDTAKHDKLIDDYLQKHDAEFDSFLLAQVSICSVEERLHAFSDNPKIVSIAKLGVKSLK